MNLIHAFSERHNNFPTVVSVGQTTIDTISLNGKPPFIQIGGSAFLPARIWATSRVTVGLVSCLGEDISINDLYLQNLDLRGVKQVPGSSTAIDLQYSNQQLVGLRVTPGASNQLAVSQIPDDYFKASLFYLSPAPLKFILELVERVAHYRISIAFSPKEDFPSLEQQDMKRVFSHCKFCFVNQRELALIANTSCESDAMRSIHEAGPEIIIVTKGHKGATLSIRGLGKIDLHPSAALRIDNPLGAGDCFAATFLTSAIAGQPAHESAVQALVYTENWLKERQRSYSVERTFQ